MNAPQALWNLQAQGRARRLTRAASALGPQLRGKRLDTAAAVQLLSAVIESGDRVCLEGNNQT
jgi:malonate decarboxylase alpha subunit